MDRNRVRVVQNKDNGLTHAFRFAKWDKANFPLSAHFTDDNYRAWHPAIPAF